MSYSVRFTEEAEIDLLRLYDHLIECNPHDIGSAERALESIVLAVESLKRFPFNCRKATAENPYLRELIISFGSSGYVALFEIEPGEIVTILAVRHQRESDYH
ncbi:type II toxin-antitoxin system RelE/ParE family toxin [Methylobacillus flagellatus]|uniref:type II toxin-antitoxin system RelE/ParE family toxin n=1 Tax=Methylobacillus flagellatus TaxID=405 RepID=UPI0028538B74|nr:type II toxin-antitoxin system RelE/ParE family toxin [Methylobacillus flagellatus]MDR5170617.1 type II toxin-antitoxin system RelE/ParE family toxin [Methylobacillus flagellatus]